MIDESKTISVYNLRVNMQVSPLGLDSQRPVFTYNINKNQIAYRLMVASNRGLLEKNTPDMWDSTKTISKKPLYIPYNGKDFVSKTIYYWKITVWDENSNTNDEYNHFETGLFNVRDWHCANWISNKDYEVAGPTFARQFSFSKKAKKARIYICGLGYNQIYLNGKKISDHLLSPPFTAYHKRVLYSTYDITDNLVCGDNLFYIMLGNGMYNIKHQNPWNFDKSPWIDKPKVILLCEITDEDGHITRIISDDKWKTTQGPVIENDVYAGETYDNSKTYLGNGFQDWDDVIISRGPGGTLSSMQIEPERIVKITQIKETWKLEDGSVVIDAGINTSGFLAVTVQGEKGSYIDITYSENLDDKKDIDQKNIDLYFKSEHFQRDRYIISSECVEEYQPSFTYHGFQYIKISGCLDKVSLLNYEVCHIHTDLKKIGEFECSNDLLSKIQKAAVQSTLTNFHGIPTDCPQREKNGWTGDAALSCEHSLLNFEMTRAYQKWLQDISDSQRGDGIIPCIVPTSNWGYYFGNGPAWDSAFIVLPWETYLYTGNKELLKKYYEKIKLYFSFLLNMSSGYITNFGLGDWCPPIGESAEHKCPSIITDTAFFFYDALTLSKIANALDQKDDCKYYFDISERIRIAFVEKFVDVETGSVLGSCQTSLATALYFDLVSDDLKEKVFNKLIVSIEETDFHIDCGILGTKFIFKVLTENKRVDLAYKIVTQEDFPSWGYWINNGATTLWETWKGDFSKNHHMFGSISSWFYKSLAGINVNEELVGFENIIIKPIIPKELEWVQAYHISPNGKIAVKWKQTQEKLLLDITIPVGSTATIYIPDGFLYDCQIFNVKDGNHSFSFKKIPANGFYVENNILSTLTTI